MAAAGHEWTTGIHGGRLWPSAHATAPNAKLAQLNGAQAIHTFKYLTAFRVRLFLFLLLLLFFLLRSVSAVAAGSDASGRTRCRSLFFGSHSLPSGGTLEIPSQTLSISSDKEWSEAYIESQMQRHAQTLETHGGRQKPTKPDKHS